MPDMGKKISYLVPKTAQMPAVAVNQVVIQTWHFNLFTKPEHRHGNGAAAGESEHDEERRLQMTPGVLQAPCDFRRHHIPRDADDEQLAKPGIEDQLRRHAESLQLRIVA